MLYTDEMDNIQYDLTHVKKILHQQLVVVYCGGEGKNHFLLLLLRKQKHWHSQKSLLLRSCMLNFNQKGLFFLATLHPPLNFSLTNNVKEYSVWLCLYEGFCHHMRSTNFSFLVATILFLKEKKRNSYVC